MPVKLNKQAFYDTRRAPKLIFHIDEITRKIAADANSQVTDEGYLTSSQQGARKPQGRWRGTVITATADAQLDNAENNTLLKAFNRQRGT